MLQYTSGRVRLNEHERAQLKASFHLGTLNKGDYLYPPGQTCSALVFLRSGIIRHFYLKENGEEVTCDFTEPNMFLTDYHSFIHQTPSQSIFEAIQPAKYLYTSRQELFRLYQYSPNMEKLGRMEAEGIALRISRMAQSLLGLKAEERYLYLLENRPALVRQVAQTHLASYVGFAGNCGRIDFLTIVILRPQHRFHLGTHSSQPYENNYLNFDHRRWTLDFGTINTPFAAKACLGTRNGFSHLSQL